MGLADNRSILIALSQDDGQDRAILSSLYTLLMRRLGWSAYLIDPSRLSTSTVSSMAIDALVGRVQPDLIRELPADLPIISTLHSCSDGGNCFSITTDDDAIGREAADYLLDRGFANFAYIGSRSIASRKRADAFSRQLNAAGVEPQLFFGPDNQSAPWNPNVFDQELTAWVQMLPVPTAILAENDLVGFRISEICRHYDIAIPNSIGVIGVGNDELICRLCHPPLTTIARPNDRIGVEIAGFLEQILSGIPPRQRHIALPHAGIIERQSVSIVCTEDVDVAEAVKFIHQNVQRQITVEDVVAAGLASRRTLERRFRNVMGQSVQSAITQSRVERAKGLLVYSRSPLQSIAQLSGFSSVQRFHVVFRRIAGATPMHYRQQFQAAGLQKAESSS